ncbi:MAG TPA: glycerol kinase [Leucothrix sp.]|nr:glycerol kinase [Leucothrix sp.]HIQ15878.1 glycerol kinase [Leucothrix sp.]
MANYILAIDQGTTSSRAIVFDDTYKICGIDQEEIEQIYPQSGWVEHNAEEILLTTISTAKGAILNAGLTSTDIVAIGITNQRETTILWDKATGKPIYNAIVWQDRRTAGFCDTLKADGYESLFSDKSGLLLDPYFSGTKINWLLNNIEGAKDKAVKGELLFGTVDCWLLWNLTKGKTHATDATNASRTLLFDIKKQQWDKDLLKLLDVPEQILPIVNDCAADYGMTNACWFGSEIPIYGIAGDQQAATLGQACFKPGMMKSTYGTGCFAMLNTGDSFILSSNRLLTTTAYRLKGKTTYALEGSIFIAGAAVQWLRDGLGIIEKASQCDAMAEASDPNQAVYLVPAFTGMGTPYWDAEARGLLCGLTRSSSPNEIVRAALEAVCYQTADLLLAMNNDWQDALSVNKGLNNNPLENKTVLRVDGGMTASNWTMQMLANILDAPVDRPEVLETTALGAAWLAGQYAGVWDNADGFTKSWRLNRKFTPDMQTKEREKKVAGWKKAVQRTLN